MYSDDIDFELGLKVPNPLNSLSDRDLIMTVLERRYIGECFVRIVNPYTETVETKAVNGCMVKDTKSIQYERVEYGHGMDVHTKFVEFDKDGKLVNMGENHYLNY